MAHSISVGVFGWESFPKPQGFYPDDMPEDWRLGFYSNEFNTACLSLAAAGCQVDSFTAWLIDLPDALQLSLYIDHSDQIPILQALLQNQGCAIYSLIVAADGGNNLLHKEYLQTVLSAKLAIYEFNELWTPLKPTQQGSRIAIFPAAKNMRQYREWIEQWLADGDSESSIEHKTLWLRGAETSHQQLSEIRMLTELMGY